MHTLTPDALCAYMKRYPAFGADLLKLLDYGCELAHDTTDYTLIGKIGGRAAALGAALELHRSLDAQAEARQRLSSAISGVPA